MAYVGGTEIIASFRIGGGGVSSINGLTGVVTLAAGTNLTIVPTGNTLTFNAFGTIAGSIAATQVAVGTGVNTIGGSSALTFVDSGSFSTLSFYDAFNTIVSSPATAASPFTQIKSSNVAGTRGSIILAVGSVQGFSVTLDGSGIHASLFGGTAGSFQFLPGSIQILGTTSGSATIGVAAVAGTPNRINLPIATGAAGTFLQTDGGSPQQTSWVALTGTTLVASGTAALGTTSIATLSSAAVVTVAAAGVLTTDSIIWAFNAAPGTGYSGTATSGLFVLAYVSSGNVNFLVINPTAGGIVPPAATLNWRVVR